MSITLDIPRELELRLEPLSPQEREQLLTQALVGHFAMEKILERRENVSNRIERARQKAQAMKAKGGNREDAFDSLRSLLDRINS